MQTLLPARETPSAPRLSPPSTPVATGHRLETNGACAPRARTERASRDRRARCAEGRAAGAPVNSAAPRRERVRRGGRSGARRRPLFVLCDALDGDKRCSCSAAESNSGRDLTDVATRPAHEAVEALSAIARLPLLRERGLRRRDHRLLAREDAQHSSASAGWAVISSGSSVGRSERGRARSGAGATSTSGHEVSGQWLPGAITPSS
jgi:hypothetical protein